jgi:MFS transporter, DHA1 family, inner membrane transport protein
MSTAPLAGDPSDRPESIGDFALARALWLLLLIAFVSQLPPVAGNLFVGIMAIDMQTTPALVGALRGLGGLAALATGVLAAPLIDRMPRAWAVAGGLVAMVAGSGLAALGQLATLVPYFVFTGIGFSILVPAIQSAAVDGRPGPVGVRAATLLTSIPALAAVVAGPLLAAPAEWWGWRADFAALAALSLLLAGLALIRLDRSPPADVGGFGYLAAFREIGTARGATALLAGSTLRSTLFLAGLTYLAPYYADQFGLAISGLGGIFGLAGSAFLLANVFGGRLLSRGTVRPDRLLLVSLLIAGLAGAAQYLTPNLSLAVALCAVHAAGHGAFLAGVVGLLVERWPRLRGALLGLNVAGQNLGVFAGAAFGGLGLALGGYPGLAASLALLAALALAVTLWALRA